jgi:hypothetical protein
MARKVKCLAQCNKSYTESYIATPRFKWSFTLHHRVGNKNVQIRLLDMGHRTAAFCGHPGAIHSLKIAASCFYCDHYHHTGYVPSRRTRTVSKENTRDNASRFQWEKDGDAESLQGL